MNEAAFSVEHPGAPALEGQGSPPPSGATPPSSSADVAPAAAAVPVLEWTPQEAAEFIASIYNCGIVPFGTRWASTPQEFAGASVHAAKIFTKYIPKGPASAADLVIGAAAIAGTLAAATAARWELIKHPKPIWIEIREIQEASAKANPPATPSTPAPVPSDVAAAIAQRPPEPTPAPANPEDNGFRLDPSLTEFARQQSQAWQGYQGLGIEP
jgi:hypothetical protein